MIHHTRSSSLKDAVVLSAFLHVAIFLVLVFLPHLVFPFRSKPISITWVELPRGTSEDIATGIPESKTLPQSTIEEQKRSAPPAVQPMIPERKTPEPTKDMQKKTPDRMAAPDKQKAAPKKRPLSETERKIQAALAGIDKDVEARSAPPQAAQTKEGGEGSKYGTSTTPLRVPPTDPEYLLYQAKVRTKLMNEWILPPRYIDEGLQAPLRAQIEVMIDLEGEVSSTRWILRSGDEAFDTSALRAVKRSSPFPQPPSRLAWEAYNEGFLIEFDPRLKQ